MSDNTKPLVIPKETAEWLEKNKEDWSVLPREESFLMNKREGEIAISDFAGGKGKYLSTVTVESNPEDKVIYNTSKTQIRVAWIREKDQIVELKIQKFPVLNGIPQKQQAEIRMDTSNIKVLTDFLEFLQEAKIDLIEAGKMPSKKKIVVDRDLGGKLEELAEDPNGKEALLEIFSKGYLTAGLDIPELIKKGLSSKVVDEKLAKLEGFKKLVNDPYVKEVGDIQNWLKQNPWIFGPEYKQLDFRGAGDQGNPDGRLLRIDGLSDILEVKLPNAEVLRKDEMGRQFMSAELSQAIGQLTGYLEHYYSEDSIDKDDKTEEEILDDRFGKYYKPKGILLIGRRFKSEGTGVSNTINAEPKKLRRLLSYFHWVEVITYDDLIERAQNGLRILTQSDEEKWL